MKKLVTLAVAALACAGGSARASAIINAVQSGNDVLIFGTGTLDLADLSQLTTSQTSAEVLPNVGSVVVGGSGTSSADALYQGAFVGPSSFGSGPGAVATSRAGDLFGLFGAISGRDTNIVVPIGYVSGSYLTGSSAYDGTTLAALGLNPGSYTYSWGLGADADHLTFNIGQSSTPTAVPEPTSFSILAFGAGIACLLLRRRSRAGRSIVG